ncbi:hypothetical protein BDV10DRAFT_126198 [Aspergillus recurvatus]
MQKCQRSAATVELSEKTPPGLTPLYNRMLQQIQRFQGLDREPCILVLSITTLGYRPLHLHELCYLAGLHKKQYGFGDLENITTLSDVNVSAAIFPSGPSAIYHRIFHESLQNLSARLRRNIYNLANPGVSASEIAIFRPDPDPLFDLRYNCTYWLGHFLEAISTSADQLNTKENEPIKAISDFFRKHLLHWLESLSLIGEVRHGILALRKLVFQQQKQVPTQPSPRVNTFKRSIRTILGGRRASKLPVSNQSVSHKQHKSIFKEFERFATS